MPKLTSEQILDLIPSIEEIGIILWKHWKYLDFIPNENELNDTLKYFAGAGLSAKELDTFFKSIEPIKITLKKLEEINTDYSLLLLELITEHGSGHFASFIQGLDVSGHAPNIFDYFMHLYDKYQENEFFNIHYYVTGATYFDQENEELKKEALENFEILSKEVRLDDESAFVEGLSFYISYINETKSKTKKAITELVIDDLIEIIINYI